MSTTDAGAGQLGAAFQQAIAHQQRGELREAQSLYEEILRRQPENAQALHLSGLIALRSGEPARALALISRAIKLAPEDAAAHFNHGVACQALDDLAAALASYDRAIARDAGLAVAHFNRGVILERLRQPEAALASYQQAIARRPKYAEALYNRGNVLRALERPDEAVASYDEALVVKPDFTAAHVNRGNALKDLGRWDAARESYERALALEPADAETRCNLGTLFYERRRPDEAVACFDRAIAMQPDFAAAYQFRAYAHLLTGNLPQGWADHEWRWQNEVGGISRARRNFVQPLWLGREALAGRRILLHCEQGLGDTLQFCRYARLVADLGAEVILEAPPALAGFLTGLEGVAQLIVRGAELPAFDYHCPLLSLPLAFNTTLATIPARVPYLHSDPEKVKHWKLRLGERRKLRVGLVWSGGFRPEQPEVWRVNRRRNIPLTKFALLRHPQIEFFSLQKGEEAQSELAQLTAANWEGPRVIDYTNELKDFSDTAALVENLDLTVSVDTSVPHLAGALGKRVWILNRFDGCWRWLLEGSDSPWYPTARLYRQERAGDWDEVLERVRSDLHQGAISMLCGLISA
jgi:tetratricopeptide (TPR) repeat protein